MPSKSSNDNNAVKGIVSLNNLVKAYFSDIAVTKIQFVSVALLGTKLPCI